MWPPAVAQPHTRAALGVIAILFAIYSVNLIAPRGAPADGVPDVPRLRIDPNTATPAELELLPGVGPALAANIVEYREQNAARPAFQSAADLDAVPRIGPATVARLREFLRFARDSAPPEPANSGP